MRRNTGILEASIHRTFSKNPRIEIWSNKDYDAKHLAPFAKEIAHEICKEHDTLKVYGLYRSNALWNFEHPFLWGLYHGYVMEVGKDSDLMALKWTCMRLEYDSDGKRRADIDVYLDIHQKISGKHWR